MIVVSQIEAVFKGLASCIPPGLLFSLSSSILVDQSYLAAYRHEFIGSLLMIAFTFSAGTWIGASSLSLAWTVHALGVVGADYIGGGPHVNPAVSVSMWSLGEVSYTEMYVRIAGQMGGGLVAFPLCRIISDALGMKEFGGPQFRDEGENDVTMAAFSEFVSTLGLCLLIYTLNWELNFGPYHYWIKQLLTALGIRYLIQVFPTSGPAINPMLGTAWAVFSTGFEGKTWRATSRFPNDMNHYLVYWVSPILGALLASFAYAVYAGTKFFGTNLPIGPLKDGVMVDSTSSLVPTANDDQKEE